MSTLQALPPFAVIEGALHAITDRLARELHEPGDVAPDWNDFEWRVARSASAMQGISGFLASRLRWRGPHSWQTFLADQRRHSTLRDERAGEILARLDRQAVGAGVAYLPLKGSALRELPVHAPGERPMSDIDVLVRPADVDAMAAVLRGIGYEPSFTSRRHHVFEPLNMPLVPGLGEHCDRLFKIEVHTAIAEALPLSMVDITESLWPRVVRAGANTYSGPPALLSHLLIHAAGNMRANALRLVQLVDIALFARKFDEPAWRELFGVPTAWWMYPPLALTARYFPLAIPQDVLAMARAACPALLRHSSARHSLTTVSWANLRVAALPGYEWSKTPLELLRYARSRAFPSRAALLELAEAVAQQPQLSRIPWYSQSHARRILRWLVSRPPRVQTMLTVLAGQYDE